MCIKSLIKHLPKLFILLLFFISCEKDQLETKSQEPSSTSPFTFAFNKVKQSQLDTNKKLSNKLEIIQQNVNQNKNTDSITIDLDAATYIESSDSLFHAYTFPVLRNNEIGILENLVLTPKNDGSYKGILVSYNLTEDDKQNLLLKQDIDTSNKITFTEIDDDDLINSLTTKNCSYEHVEVCVITPCSIDGCWGAQWTGVQCNIVLAYVCGDDSSIPLPGTTLENTQTVYESGSGLTGNTLTFPTPSPKTQMDWFVDGLDKELHDFIVDETNLVLYNQTYNFLKQYSFSEDTIEFTIAGISAIMSGGEVDWEEKIILDQTVINNQKVNCVYEKLKGLSNTIFNDIVNDHFDSSKNAHIRFKIQTPNGGEDAYTLPRYNGSYAIYEIQLNPTAVENASTIEIALMLIHESIHAELMDRCLQLGIIDAFSQLGNPNFTDPSNTFTTYESLFALLVDVYRNYNGDNNQWNHDLFNVLNYRTEMAQNLVDIHQWLNDPNNDFLNNVNNDNNGVGGPYTIQQLMGYLSWVGLEATQEYINDIDNNPVELQKKQYVELSARTKYTNNCN